MPKGLLKVAFLLGIIFFVAGALTLPHYGINWDTINHLPRGQSYLHYFLTGKKDFSDLPKFQWYWQKDSTLLFSPDISRENIPRVSLYQNTGIDFTFLINNDGGHPPLSDILSSLFNYVLFQKLGLINDIDAYRIYSIFLGSALVALIFYWVSKLYGKFCGFISAISLALYPLFWSEVHFNNEKDIPETVYISFMLFSLWKGVVDKKAKWIIVAGLFAGLALGTKLNLIFTFLIIIPWLFIFLLRNRFQGLGRILIGGAVASLVALVIFIGTWPYLWADPIARIQDVLGYYKQIGITDNFDLRYVWQGILNIYPLQWILFTTPIPVLIFTFLGIMSSFKKLENNKSLTPLLFIFWLFMPIIRVTWAKMTIYGGVRQIMEYVPAMAILSGLGAGYLFRLIKNKFVKILLGLLTLALLFYPIVKIHPNENVYFNFLIGGLSGAKDKNIPSWGNSFGAAYRQGVDWLNTNAPQNAGISYARELAPNIPNIWLRKDLVLHNGFRSGFLREGEYIIGLTYQGTSDTSYFDRYLERYLIPVYEVKVDGVPILKVWKNDVAHTKKEYLAESKLSNFVIKKVSNGILIDLGSSQKLSRLESNYSEINCDKVDNAYVQISNDGSKWERLPGTMPNEDWSVPKLGNQPLLGKMVIPFAADQARFVNLVVSPSAACLINFKNVNMFVLK